jgi:hypothetical protein
MNSRKALGQGAVYGSKNGNAKLTPKSVKNIRRLYRAGNITHRILAASYDVSRSTIGQITRGVTWLHSKEQT